MGHASLASTDRTALTRKMGEDGGIILAFNIETNRGGLPMVSKSTSFFSDSPEKIDGFRLKFPDAPSLVQHRSQPRGSPDGTRSLISSVTQVLRGFTFALGHFTLDFCLGGQRPMRIHI